MIIIDGVVGCGKTTLAKKISERTGYVVYEELQKQSTYKLLEKFYEDKNRWSFALQIHFLNERFKMIKDITNTEKKCILDRSIFGDRIFASMLNEDGFMTDEEFETYDTLLNSMLEHCQMPSKLIYIDCNLETAIKRINKRNRKMELDTPISYWKRLNEKYNDWYNSYDLSDKVALDALSYDPNKMGDIDKIINELNLRKSF